MTLCHFNQQVIHITDNIVLELLELLDGTDSTTNFRVVWFQIQLGREITVRQFCHSIRNLQNRCHDIGLEVNHKANQRTHNHESQNIANNRQNTDKASLCINIVLFALRNRVLQGRNFHANLGNAIVVLFAVYDANGFGVLTSGNIVHCLLLERNEVVRDRGNLLQELNLLICQTNCFCSRNILITVLGGIDLVPVIIIVSLFATGRISAHLIGQIGGRISERIGIHGQIVQILIRIIQMSIGEVNQHDRCTEGKHQSD